MAAISRRAPGLCLPNLTALTTTTAESFGTKPAQVLPALETLAVRLSLFDREVAPNTIDFPSLTDLSLTLAHIHPAVVNTFGKLKKLKVLALVRCSITASPRFLARTLSDLPIRTLKISTPALAGMPSETEIVHQFLLSYLSLRECVELEEVHIMPTPSAELTRELVSANPQASWHQVPGVGDESDIIAQFSVNW